MFGVANPYSPVYPQNVESGEHAQQHPPPERSPLRALKHRDAGPDDSAQRPDDLQVQHTPVGFQACIPAQVGFDPDAEQGRGHQTGGDGVNRLPSEEAQEFLRDEHQGNGEEHIHREVDDEPGSQGARNRFREVVFAHEVCK